MGHYIDLPVIMPFAEWVDMPDHPLQRDTARHARKTKRSIHTKDHPDHRRVVASRIGPAGRLHKVDGHTRTFHWLTGHLTAPVTVVVTIYEASDEEDFNDHYYVFDNPTTIKSAADDLHGVFNHLGMDLQTPRIRNGGVASALAEAWGIPSRSLRGLPTNETLQMVNAWKDEILLADSLYDPAANPPRGLKAQHNNATVAAMLLTFRRYGAEVIPFWSDVTADVGIKSGREMCPVEAANRIMRLQYQGGGGITEPTERLLSAVLAWRKGRSYKSLPGRTDINVFRKAAERAKQHR